MLASARDEPAWNWEAENEMRLPVYVWDSSPQPASVRAGAWTKNSNLLILNGVCRTSPIIQVNFLKQAFKAHATVLPPVKTDPGRYRTV